MIGTVAKRIFVIAGPNGAGKTTFATEFLPNEADCPIFVNADLSGRAHGRRIVRWREQGYRVKLFFLRLPTPEAAMARVAQRVSEGGHDVPEAVIRQRFHAGWRNFEGIYRELVDGWAVYDNSDDVPILLEEGSRE